MTKKLPKCQKEGDKPKEFELCLLDIGEKKLVAGWWTGFIWDGLRYNGEKVYYWKRIDRR